MRMLFLQVENTLLSHQWYRNLKRRIFRLKFSLKQKIFNSYFQTKLLNLDIGIAGIISRSSIKPMILTILVGASVLIVNLLILSLLPSRFSGWGVIFQIISSKNNSAYDSFLGAILTIAGLFLTLYLTNINTLAGTVYISLPKKLRDSFIKERVSNIYIKYLILVLLLCMFFLSIGAITGLRTNFIIIFIGILSFFAIQAFVKLGERSYVFIDPTALVNNLLWEIDLWSNQATINGYAWEDESFQGFYNQKAHDAIEGLNSLVSVCHKESHLQQDSLKNLLHSTVIFLRHYLQKKRIIPSNSRWYEQKPEHQSWYLSSDISVNLATQAGTELFPKSKGDDFWIEKELIGLQIISLEACLKDGRKILAISILDNLNSILGDLGRDWFMEYGGQTLREVSDCIYKSIEHGWIAEPKRGYESTPGTVEDLAIIDYLGMLPITLFLSFIKSTEKIDLHVISKKLKRVNWRDKRDIYKLLLPARILPRIEYISKGLNFEIESEGKVITADWYINQLIIQELASAFEKQVDSLKSTGVSIYGHSSDWLEKNYYFLSAALLGRGLEYCGKLLGNFEILFKMSELFDSKRVEKDIPWPSWNWKDIECEVKEFNKELHLRYLNCIPGLMDFKRTKNLPDYLGRAVHLAGEMSYQALASNDFDSFQKIFNKYFYGVWITINKLREETKDWHLETAIQAFVEPLMDLCDLSGYALFWSEFHTNNTLWKYCQNLWDIYFNGDERRDRLIFISTFLSYHSRLFMITHREVLRTEWQRRAYKAIRNLQRKTKIPHTMSVIPDFISIVDHPSLLIRVWGGIEAIPFDFYQGIDIFVDLYLREFEEAEGLDFGNVHGIKDELDRSADLERDENDELSNELGYADDDEGQFGEEIEE